MNRIAVIALLGVWASCAGPSADAADGSKGARPISHPLCPRLDAVPTFSEEIGDFCPMGSNLGLCATSPSSSCAETGVCVWHADDVTGQRAYCTIACDPSTEQSCPPRFTCVAQGCTSGPPNICARTEAEPEDVCEDATSMLSGRGFSARSVARAGEQIYIAGYATQPDSKVVVITRGVKEDAWRLLHEGPVYGTLDWSPLTAGDAVFFQSFSGSQQRLLRVEGDMVKEDPLPTCNDDPNICVTQIDLVFETAEGAVRALGRGTAGHWLLERDAQGAWTVARRLDHKLLWPHRFTRQGFAASCHKSDEPFDARLELCVSYDGTTMTVLEPPPGHFLDSGLRVHGQSPDDFYILFATGLWHRVQGLWLEEGVPVAGAGRLAQAEDGSLFAQSGAALYQLEGGCWRQLAQSRDLEGLLPLDQRQFLALPSDNELCRVTLEQ